MDELTRDLRALANKRRLTILKYLKRTGEASVSDIASEIKLSFKSTSRHLSVLTGAYILEKEQTGLTVMHNIASRKHPIVAKTLSLL